MSTNESARLLGGGFNDIALVGEEDRIVRYGDLARLAGALPDTHGGLVLLRAENSLDVISTYIACVVAGAPVALVDQAITEEHLVDLVKRYRPAVILNSAVPLKGYAGEEQTSFAVKVQSRKSAPPPTHPDLALLLATSGSTGNPKFVKLSRDALLSNANSIAEGLGIDATDRAITSLPPSYTYGLSVINSHLIRGASIGVTDAGVVSAPFWERVKSNRVSTIAGVPTTYRMLRQMRWDPADYPELRYLTQAGGRLPDLDRQYFLDTLAACGKDFYVMYGQTEATARMTIAPPTLLREHISTAGRAIFGGSLTIDSPDVEGVGGVVYQGPNVMMGYADGWESLATGDELSGKLETGDLGYLSDGMLFLTGRSKRIVKVFGIRVSLDDVDRWLQEHGNGVAVQGDDAVELFIEHHSLDDQQLRRQLAERLGVHSSGISITHVDSIPLLSSGKVDYVGLRGGGRP